MTAIEFENISKQYRLGLVSTGTLSHDLNRFWQTKVLRREDPYLKVGEVNDRAHKGASEYVWALKDINFKVEQGDVVGIIGRNGAGKSTLLKLLSRVTAPTTGTIRARGRIASLLEVGTGFHPEMTGRENIYMNGAIMGMSRAEITRKLDEIVDFSGCERYLDTPVKRYSSGMTVRLGFAIAAHLEPEILVVDEVLAVGDAEFQKKAIGKMQDVSRSEGRTVLFVSHNMASIRALCNQGVLLEKGKIDYVDKIEHVVNKYISTHTSNLSNELQSWTNRQGNGRVKFKKVYVTDLDGNELITILTGSNVVFHFEISSEETCEVDLGFSFFTSDDTMISNLYSSFQHTTFNVQKGNYTISCLVENFAFASPELYIRGVINADKQLADWPSCHLAKINIEQGNFYGSGVLAPPKNMFLFKGSWTIK
ncbi:ABC transporter ATP-binding protein [uncultured Fibrobacter sp.]|uniref:ABC transporter ATP-binding protein n=1 Tax=uncultured Fibrobacter sp. TaxID=261512 RepID=UPI0025CED7D6|nr:ABC transporter ATP-binding protein [uncultured Fibrobacter sp.]